MRIYERDHIYPQSLAGYLDLIRLNPKKYPFVLNYWSVMFFGKQYFWARHTDILEKSFRKWFKKWCEDKKAREFIYDKLGNNHHKFVKKLSKLKITNLTKLADKDLANVRNQVISIMFEYLKYSEYCVDLFDDYIGALFQEKILALSGAIPAPSSLVLFLHPSTVSSVVRYQRELLILSLDGSISQSSIDNLAKKFCWIKMAWDGSGELTAKDIKHDIALLKKKGKQSRMDELKKIKDFFINILRARKMVLAKYKIEPSLMKIYFELLDKFVVYHDYRKEVQMRCAQIIYGTLQEIARRRKISYDDLMYYSNEEINSLLIKNIFVKADLIAKRRMGLLWVINQGKIKEYLGNEAQKKAQELVWSKFNHQTKEIKGLPASRGVIIGRAFVTKDAKEANKLIKVGEILVSAMTLPDCVPAMKRVGGIVTDDGGATCHAAIVSRELGIPCVVGTKNATAVIKTGDMVEVDANHGIIRIIK